MQTDLPRCVAAAALDPFLCPLLIQTLLRFSPIRALGVAHADALSLQCQAVLSAPSTRLRTVQCHVRLRHRVSCICFHLRRRCAVCEERRLRWRASWCEERGDSWRAAGCGPCDCPFAKLCSFTTGNFVKPGLSAHLATCRQSTWFMLPHGLETPESFGYPLWMPTLHVLTSADIAMVPCKHLQLQLPPWL